MYKTINDLRQVCERVNKARESYWNTCSPDCSAPVSVITELHTAESEFSRVFSVDTILQLLDQLAAAQLTWTTEKPTKAGWYWHRGIKPFPEVVEVIDRGNGFSCRHTGDGILYTIPRDDDRGDHGEWAGPLRIPGEI